MNKFLFKSNDSDLQKMLINKLDMLLAEQRHQRADLSHITRLLRVYETEFKLQKQVDEFFEDGDKENIPDSEQVQP